MAILEGKTKRIVSTETEFEVRLETKDDLTAGDAAKTAKIKGIAEHKTRQTKDVFQLLERQGIATAFIRQEDATNLICEDCDMLPLEMVMRRYAWGSYLKREPALVSTAERPFRFDTIKTELFHKHAVVTPPASEVTLQMGEGEARDLYLKDGVWATGVHTDPLIQCADGKWFLHSAKKPVDSAKPLLEIAPVINEEERKMLISEVMVPVFEVLESAWAGIETEFGPVALVDIKIECGRRKRDGKLVVADVIDNDSWRIWPGGDPTKQLDKQAFRDGDALSDVAENYELVARLTDQF